MRVVANGVWGHVYGGACDDRVCRASNSGGSVRVERVAVVLVCVSSVCVCVTWG